MKIKHTHKRFSVIYRSDNLNAIATFLLFWCVPLLISDDEYISHYYDLHNILLFDKHILKELSKILERWFM